MTRESNPNKRLSFSLLFSFLLHSAIIAVLVIVYFWQSENLRFKSGTGQNPQKIKISGFLKDAPNTHANLARAPQGAPIPPTTQSQSSSNPQKSTQKDSKDSQNKRESERNLQSPNQDSKDSKSAQDSKNSQNAQNTPESLNLQSLSLNSQSGVQAKEPAPLSRILSQYSNVDSITKRDVIELYGEEFGDYGVVERDFIINNLRDIGRITARYLTYPRDAIRLGQQGVNIVEFYLHPNGDISELKLLKSSGYVILDRNSERTIEIAYKDYPHPISKTLIRIRVSMELFYY
ncbi:energy transducer TonB [Helicobacter sp. MIT 00-7814]|uniref:energy transducer TonB n=1 Tax=unclassified Helicobacter TaxID=2593540 RepID=UPI000E1E3C77|nr:MULTISPECIES: energy transducer TonB [unclassified Helicobacter]RDU52270.1 energy transducer TonB [Helicobacter sp. MIT 00-7814]RDU52297.1 energy transducer TonB [Helicobacter sp. MIT 99-10781]